MAVLVNRTTGVDDRTACGPERDEPWVARRFPARDVGMRYADPGRHPVMRPGVGRSGIAGTAACDAKNFLWRRFQPVIQSSVERGSRFVLPDDGTADTGLTGELGDRHALPPAP